MIPFAKNVAFVAVALAIAIAAGTPAAAEPRNFKQTHYFKLFGSEGDSSGERSGYEADNRAYPSSFVEPQVRSKAAGDADQLDRRPSFGDRGPWTLVGPVAGTVPGEVSYTGHASTVSGRVTSLAISPRCDADDCALLVGAAGGGVWLARNGLSRTPDWKSQKEGLPTNAIGALIFDPTDASARTLYAGTGEASGSSDSEAGLGLFRSDDLGSSWDLVRGSAAVATGRAIGAIGVDRGPDDPGVFRGPVQARPSRGMLSAVDVIVDPGS